MNDIVDLLGLREILPEPLHGVAPDFEALYDQMVETPEYADLIDPLETRVREYFEDLCLPETATVYDRLLLSLRPKDLVATFNWDPFLVQAFRRNAPLQRLPELAFLHGNVAIGACVHRHRMGYLNTPCEDCGENLQPSALLYPVRNKDYRTDLFIKTQWRKLEIALDRAYYLTIFGYSAPRSDAAAIDVFQNQWRKNRTHRLAQINVIDIESPEVLESRWRPFFVGNHYGFSTSLENSWLSRNPRRTCEALAHATLLNLVFKGLPFPSTNDLHQLQRAVLPLIEEENALNENGTPFRTSWE